MATTTHTKKLYTLEKPTWLDKAGFSKGITHDRQHLGIILGPNATLKIRQTNPKVTAKLTLQILNYDSQLEQELSVSKEWQTFSNNATPSVPFIDTLFIPDSPVVEFEYATDSKILPIYQKHDSQEDFFKLWDSQNAEFGLVRSTYVQILVPVVDKEVLRNLKVQPNIDAMIDYFDRILTFYNDLSGVSFEPTKRATDRNIPSRYFLKADAHGIGGAYYGGNWAAESNSSMKGFWLNCQDSTWGNLHEIGHGFQGGFMNTHGFSVGEVWNNVYAATFQNTFLGDKIWTNGWLYDYGKSAGVFAILTDLITKGTKFQDWDLRSKLVALVLMKERAGNTAFTHFNQRYRKECNDPEFAPAQYTLLDMLSESYGKMGKIDITPFALLIGGIMTGPQIRRNALFHEKAVYPLNYLVTADTLPKLQTMLNLKNPFSLVDPGQLKITEIKGDLELTLDIDNFKEIYGETLTLFEGQRYAYTERITTPTLLIQGVPIGVYTLVVPTGKGTKYAFSTNYIISKEGGNKVTVQFKPKRTSPLLNSGFNILGLSNSLVATVKVDYEANLIAVEVFSEEPHYYFEGKQYAHIKVTKNSGETLFDKEIMGTGVTLVSQKIPFEIGYKIELTHQEPDRLRATDDFGKNAPFKIKLNTFTIGELGVKNNDPAAEILKDPATDLKAKIEKEAVAIRSELRRLISRYDTRKDNLYLALGLFPEAEREALRALYKDVLPTDNEDPGPLVGQTFQIELKGLGDRVFCKVSLDLVKRVITLESIAGPTHSYFKELYAALRFLDANGVERANLRFDGDKPAVADKKTFNLAFNGGEELTIHHKEPTDRLVIQNEMQGVRVASQRNLIYGLVHNGLVLKSSSSGPDLDPKV